MTIAQAIVSLSTKITEYVENISKPLSEWRQKLSTSCFLPFAWQSEKRQHGSLPKPQYESTTRPTAVGLERNRNFHTRLHEQDHKWDWYGNNLIRRVFCQTSHPTKEPEELISDENIRLPSTKKGQTEIWKSESCTWLTLIVWETNLNSIRESLLLRVSICL